MKIELEKANYVPPPVKPRPKPTLTFSYGNWRFKGLKDSLKGDDHKVRIKALIEINEDFHDAEKIN